MCNLILRRYGTYRDSRIRASIEFKSTLLLQHANIQNQGHSSNTHPPTPSTKTIGPWTIERACPREWRPAWGQERKQNRAQDARGATRQGDAAVTDANAGQGSDTAPAMITSGNARQTKDQLFEVPRQDPTVPKKRPGTTAGPKRSPRSTLFLVVLQAFIARSSTLDINRRLTNNLRECLKWAEFCSTTPKASRPSSFKPTHYISSEPITVTLNNPN